MELQDACLLRLYISETDRLDGRPAWEALLALALEAGLAGGTVLHGVAGFGTRHQLHAAKVLRLAEKLPLVVELVDESPRLEAFLAQVGPRLTSGLATLEKVRALPLGG
ncbi:MAG: DUF190 domain-containing protein [Candidatus Delongbacteria bacterium]